MPPLTHNTSAPQLQELLRMLAQEVPVVDPWLDAVKMVGGVLVWNVFLGALVGALILLLLVLSYRPRTPRGGLWVPFFGLFGGAPTLYLHRRPASLFGLVLGSRRRCH